MAAIEARLVEERERSAAILAELVAAGELGEAPKGFAAEVSALRGAISDVLKTWTSCGAPAMRPGSSTCPALPRRAMN